METVTWVSITSKGKYPGSFLIFQICSISICIKIGSLGVFQQNWAPCKSFAICTVHSFSLPLFFLVNLKMWILLMFWMMNCICRDVGDNHLVGTIRELIRIEGCFPALRNLYAHFHLLLQSFFTPTPSSIWRWQWWACWVMGQKANYLIHLGTGWVDSKYFFPEFLNLLSIDGSSVKHKAKFYYFRMFSLFLNKLI